MKEIITYTNSKTICSTNIELRLYKQNLLPSIDAWKIENHLLGCEKCRTKLNNLSIPQTSHLQKNMYLQFKKRIAQNLCNSLELHQLTNSFIALDKCQPFATYEIIINDTAMSNSQFKLKKPKLDSVFDKGISFEWQGQLENINLIIEDNATNPILKRKIHNNHLLIFDKEKFDNGLYYYKLINSNTLLKIGKFYLYKLQI